MAGTATGPASAQLPPPQSTPLPGRPGSSEPRTLGGAGPGGDVGGRAGPPGRPAAGLAGELGGREESLPPGARREGVGVPARGRPRHREGAAAARRRRAWEARSLRHGRYHPALGRGNARSHHLARRGEAAAHLGAGQSYHRGRGRSAGPRFLVESEEEPVHGSLSAGEEGNPVTSLGGRSEVTQWCLRCYHSNRGRMWRSSSETALGPSARARGRAEEQ